MGFAQDSLVESEFFGHEKGAFTGAIAEKEGLIEKANNGTLLIDHISEIPLDIQSKILRVLIDQKFKRINGSNDIKVDVRLICSSNKDLKNEIRSQFKNAQNKRICMLMSKRFLIKDSPSVSKPLKFVMINLFCIFWRLLSLH